MHGSSDDARDTFGDAEALRRRREGMERFNRWEATHPSRLSAADAVAAIGALYALLPEGSRERPVDPSGVQEMHRRLAVLTETAR